MKTIADAHRELNGDLSNSFSPQFDDELLFFRGVRGFYVCLNKKVTAQKSDQYICTVEEFNNYKGESMKTVMDAVNEFKGVWPSDSRYIVASKCHISNWRDDEDIRLLAREWDVISNEEEFNTRVQECMTNFGSSVTYDEYLKELENKVDVEIDYKYTGKSNGFFTHGKIYKVSECDDEHVTDDDNADSRHELSDDYLSKNFVKLFTQEMSDNGELPPIGSKFIDIEFINIELSDDGEVVEAIAHDVSLGRVVYRRGSTLQDSEYFGATASECRPIDTRTDKKKAFDEYWKTVPTWNSPEDYKCDMREAFNAGVKWVGK